MSSVTFIVTKPFRARVDVVNIIGKLYARKESYLEAGEYELKFDLPNPDSSKYFYHICDLDRIVDIKKDKYYELAWGNMKLAEKYQSVI